MQQMMRLFTAVLTKVFIIQSLDGLVLVGLADHGLLIIRIERAGAFLTIVRKVADLGRYLRLSAAVYAAAGAGHDLDEIIGSGSGFDLVQDLSCVARPDATATLTVTSQTL